jgi:hypothetical protein
MTNVPPIQRPAKSQVIAAMGNPDSQPYARLCGEGSKQLGPRSVLGPDRIKLRVKRPLNGVVWLPCPQMTGNRNVRPFRRYRFILDALPGWLGPQQRCDFGSGHSVTSYRDRAPHLLPSALPRGFL